METIAQISQFFNDSEDFHGNIKLNENLSSHTTMHVGGEAKIFLEPEDSDSMIFTLNYLIEEKCGFFILGGGSNVIISDAGLPLVISTRKMNKIKLLTRHTEVTEKNQNDEKTSLKKDSLCPPKPYEHSSSGDSLKSRCDFLTLPICEVQIDSGSSWGSVISFCKKENLGGFEGFTGLSGTVGGALFMNATCFGLSACDNLISAEYFDSRDGKIHVYEKKESDWGYKKSPFQSADCTDFTDGGVAGDSPQRGERATKCERGERLLPFVILSAKFALKPGFDSAFSEKCMSERKEKGHFRAPSSGSAFKNDSARGIIAGKVIDECGLKGFSAGGAQIAPWHGNFIINPEQKATAADIKNLSDQVKRIVLEKKGISLENEIIFAGVI
ncbi:hypothetical protein [Treponema sp.]|uniref:UDP-N-acetylmuramate dehydrogenase n=1 Tax=Treponema sp. TaxID=166 RepID=UPI0025D0A34B|nr:hypothetical protein [Treponema sp.]